MIFADVRLRGVMNGIDLAREVKMRWPSSLRPQTTLRDEGTISGHNIARDLSVTVDVGFCQIGKCQAIRFAA